jgi:hypothetical protein
VATRPAGNPSGGEPPAVERQLHFSPFFFRLHQVIPPPGAPESGAELPREGLALDVLSALAHLPMRLDDLKEMVRISTCEPSGGSKLHDSRLGSHEHFVVLVTFDFRYLASAPRERWRARAGALALVSMEC